MGPTASQIREELDHHREDAASRLTEIENRVQNVTSEARSEVDETKEQIRSQVEDAKEQVKQTFDVKYQLQQNPLIAVGGGLLLGFLVGGGLSGGGGGGGHHSGQRSSSSVGGHLQASLMQSGKSSGLSDTLSSAGSALLAEVTKSVKGAVGQK